MTERVRASRIKAGLTCEGVRLFGVAPQTECCRDCHNSDNKPMSPHMLQWVDCPPTPTGVINAQVCCKLNRLVRQWAAKGKWPQNKDFSVDTLMAKQFADHPSWVASHLPKTTICKWFDGEFGSTEHKKLRYIQMVGPENVSIDHALCIDPECKHCGASLHCYWSYKLQGWVPMKFYGMLDNFFALSPTHQNHGKCEVPGHVVMHQVTHVPEYAAYLCKDLNADAAYRMNPMFGAATADKKYIVHLVAGPVNALKEMAEIVPLIEKVVNH